MGTGKKGGVANGWWSGSREDDEQCCQSEEGPEGTGIGVHGRKWIFFFLKDNGKILGGVLSREMIQYDLCHLLSSQHKIYHIYQAF